MANVRIPITASEKLRDKAKEDSKKYFGGEPNVSALARLLLKNYDPKTRTSKI